MLNDNAKAWVAKLRDPDMPQTKHSLCRLDENNKPKGFCCLGVACEVYNELSDSPLNVDNYLTDRSYGGHTSTLPSEVAQWLGLSPGHGGTGSFGDDSLAARNDLGATFAEIADLIESEPEGLFSD